MVYRESSLTRSRTMDRIAHYQFSLKCFWILSVIRGTEFRSNVIIHNLFKLDDVLLEHHIRNDYYDVKTEIVYQMNRRRKEYEANRDAHKEQKTADKQFYRFLQATGYTIDVDPIKLPIRRLIKIYSVYFQDLDKLKKDLDKKGQSPYI